MDIPLPELLDVAAAGPKRVGKKIEQAQEDVCEGEAWVFVKEKNGFKLVFPKKKLGLPEYLHGSSVSDYIERETGPKREVILKESALPS